MNKYEAVFISDLHLHPERKDISERFQHFISWAKLHTKSLYILGDFFHVWPGDDGFDPWSLQVAHQLKQLTSLGIPIYFMPGNRDFLIGKHFYEESGAIQMVEPFVLNLPGTTVLLAHGDRFCTKDRSHQWFRKITRNPVFIGFFLKLPFKLRNRLVNRVRDLSQQGAYKPSIMGTVASVVVQELQNYQLSTVIHGHTHTPGLTKHHDNNRDYQQYILSDWDDKPQLLCYDQSKGFHFIQRF